MMPGKSSTIQSLHCRLTQQMAGFTESAALDAQVLIAHAARKSRSWVLSHPEESLEPEARSWLDSALQRFFQGEPLPYILGEWEFFGLSFKVSPAVLIPRPETELLVEHALVWCRQQWSEDRRSLHAVDVGTGSGCIAVSLAANLPEANLLSTLCATDLSQSALKIARHNASKHHLGRRISWLQSDLLSSCRSHSLDLICANLPYISSELLPSLPVARYEPWLALDGGTGGLIQIHRLLDQASHCLRPGGLLLAEIEISQGEAVLRAASTRFPGARFEMFQDLAGCDRLLSLQKTR